MPPQEQADLWMALRDRMKVNWAELTVQEKKAGGFSSFFSLGPWVSFFVVFLELELEVLINGAWEVEVFCMEIRSWMKNWEWEWVSTMQMITGWRWLTLQFAAYYIAFGAHGPRAATPPGEGWKVAAYTAVGVGASLALFVLIRQFAGGDPATMTKEYQEATNEYLKVRSMSILPVPKSQLQSSSGNVELGLLN
jgi:hypothetical protein